MSNLYDLFVRQTSFGLFVYILPALAGSNACAYSFRSLIPLAASVHPFQLEYRWLDWNRARHEVAQQGYSIQALPQDE